MIFRTLPLITLIFSGHYLFGQNTIDKYLTGIPIQTTVANANQNIKSPRDLDFNPKQAKQLWIANFGTLNSGGDMIILSNAGETNQTSVLKTDEWNGHFLNSTSALSFSNNGNFGTCGELINSPGDTKEFMGPALWQTSIFGVPNSNGSSHVDMLHESPYGMGIEAEKDNSFWVFDGFNGNICKYNFHIPHEPGAHDHGDGELARYEEVKVLRKNDVPSHLVRDKASNWLYIVDGGNKRILRMNIASGQKGADMQCNEQYYNGCYTMKNVTWEVYVNTGLVSPSGIDFKNGRLVVSDNSNGDIIIYNTTGSKPTELGRVRTQVGIMGVKIGEDNKIWYVNNKLNTVVRLDYPLPTGVDNVATTAIMNEFPNPASDYLTISLQMQVEGDIKITLNNILGKEIRVISEGTNLQIQETISLAGIEKGIYTVNYFTNQKLLKSKLLIIQ